MRRDGRERPQIRDPLCFLALIPAFMTCVAGAKLTVMSGRVLPGIVIGSAGLAVLCLMTVLWSRIHRQSIRLPS